MTKYRGTGFFHCKDNALTHGLIYLVSRFIGIYHKGHGVDYMKLFFLLIIITISVAIVFLTKGIVVAINLNLMKIRYRLTSKFTLYFIYIAIFILAIIIGKKLLYGIL